MKTLFAFLICSFAQAATHEIGTGERITVKSGDVVKLKGGQFSVTVGGPYEPVKCAIPGRNCGAGYQPPAPTFEIKCAATPCPYIFDTYVKDGSTAEVIIHTEESCSALKHQADNCFYSYARNLKSAEGCLGLKTALGRYHCVQRFHGVALPQLKSVCDELPVDIYALRENCYYDWAERYKDASFCEKYAKTEENGRSRCLGHMAQVLQDKSLCAKIPVAKDNSYRQQCDEIQLRR